MSRPRAIRTVSLLLAILLAGSCTTPAFPPGSPFSVPPGEIALAFAVASDMRGYTGTDPRYFRGVAERLAAGGPGAFMISAGDIDPPDEVYNTLQTYIDPEYGWFPVVGNHEAETSSDMEYLRAFTPGGAYTPDAFFPGPAASNGTVYSFDAGGIHFVVLNEYFDGLSDVGAPDGNVSDALHAWLDADLAAQIQDTILVIGHEPAFVFPDDETGRVRHDGNSLDLFVSDRDRFWNTLGRYGVTAYVCGHTHNYSAEPVDGVWQVDSGHARGTGDTGAPSTFLMFYRTSVGGLWLQTYRLDGTQGYVMFEELQLK